MRINYTYLLLIALVFFGGHSLNAQVIIGISGGLNLNIHSPQIADVSLVSSSTNYKTSKSKRGFYGQVSSQVNLNKYIDLLMLAGFSVRRFEEVEKLDGAGIQRHENKIFTVKQINFGTVLLYGLPLGSGKASIGAGGNISYPISAKLKSTLQGFTNGSLDPPIFRVSKHDTTSQKFVPGALALFRYEFNFGAIFEIRYNYQFRTIPGVNLSIFELGAGYNFRFKRKKSSSIHNKPNT